jgi:enoyl-CoA hydratase
VTEHNAWTAFDLEKRGPIALVTLRGPGTGNAMGPEFFEELPRLMTGLNADPDVRAVILAGGGEHFSFGLDLVRMSPLLTKVAGTTDVAARVDFLGYLRAMQDAISSVADSPTPVVVAVSGWCIGGGLDLAAAADVRVASADARFSLRESKMAMVADLGSLQRLAGVIGDGHLRQIALTGEDLDAARALRIGLVNDVFDTPEEAVEAALRIAGEIAANSPLVSAGVKEILDAERRARVAASLRYVAAWNAAFIGSYDLSEALAAFVDRREPIFTGR